MTAQIPQHQTAQTQSAEHILTIIQIQRQQIHQHQIRQIQLQILQPQIQHLRPQIHRAMLNTLGFGIHCG